MNRRPKNRQYNAKDVALIVRGLCDEDIISDSAAKRVVQTVFSVLSALLSDGHDVSISRFGRFRAVRSPQRTVRNPATGEAMQVPEKLRVRFHSGRILRESLNKGDKSV